MNSLDKNQIELIESDVERARIILETLSQELVDHICCEVENEMEKNGKTFEEAYAIIKQQTGIQVLQKIQENTLYLIDKKYALMKNTMKITGTISLATLAMGTLFKIMHWPGAGPMLLFGFALLCLVFFPAAIYISNSEGKTKSLPVLNFSLLIGGTSFMAGILFKVMHWPGSGTLLLTGWAVLLGIFLPILLYVKLKEATSGKEKGIYVLGVLALVAFELATMFKMFHWPGAGPLMLLGSVSLIAVFLPMFAALKYKSSEKSTGKFIFLVITFMYAIVFTALLAMNVSGDILSHFVRQESNSTSVINYFEKKKEQQAKTVSLLPDSVRAGLESQIAQVSKQAGELRKFITNTKLDLIQRVEGVDEQTAKGLMVNPSQLIRKDNYDVVNWVLFDNEGNGIASELKMAIEKFRGSSMQITSFDTELSKSIAKLLSTEPQMNENDKKSWEEKTFRNNMLANALSVLSGIERNVLVVETETIQSLIQK